MLKQTVMIMLAAGLWACQQPRAADQERPEVATLLRAADSVRLSDAFSDRVFHTLDSALNTHAPLRPTELLQKYDLYHWYYAEFLYRRYDDALAVSDSALALFKDKPRLPDYVALHQKWLIHKGDDLIKLKRLHEAFQYYYEVMEQATGEQAACQRHRIATQLGNVRYMQGDYAEAIRYYKSAFELNRACRQAGTPMDYYDAVTEPQGKLNGIALFHEHGGQLDSALHYYHLAMDFLERESAAFPGNTKDKDVALGVIYGNLGGVLTKLGRHDEAEKLLLESIAINTKPAHDHRDALTAQLRLADLYIRMDNLPEADATLRKSDAVSDSLPSDETFSMRKKARWQLERKRGDHQAALHALEDYQLFTDSVRKRHQHILNTDFVTAFTNMEQARALSDLTNRNRQNHILLLAAVALVLSLLAIVALIFRNARKSQRLVRNLELLNARVHERNEKLQLTLEALQASQQENTRIVAMVVHDLKGPIGSAKIATQYLMHRKDIEPEKAENMLEVINRASNQALALIGELGESNAHDLTDNKSLMNLETMIQDCVALLKLRAEEKKQTLEATVEPVYFFCNGEKLWRIISNLLINAIKFTPLGGRIHVKLHQAAGHMVIEVADNGIGIPKQLLEGLFDISVRSGRIGTAGEPSTGLGLAIVKQIVTSYRGRIAVESAEGAGTTFRLSFPLEQGT